MGLQKLSYIPCERYAPCVICISAIVVTVVGRFSLDLPETFLYSIAWGSSLAKKIH